MLKIRRTSISDAKDITKINIITWKISYKGLFSDEFLANRNINEKRIQNIKNQINNTNDINSRVYKLWYK